jgi:hypothetical protein
VDSKILKNAVLHGNIMGSFAIEEYGVEKIVSINADDIKKRHEKYKEIFSF